MGKNKEVTFKLFQTGALNRRKALPFFTKALPRTEVFGGSLRIEPQNLRYSNQYHSGRTQNQNGPECDGNRTRPSAR